MYHAHEQDAVCVSAPRQCENKPACGIRAQDLPQSLFVFAVIDVPRGTTGGPFGGGRPLQGWKSKFVARKGVCSMALKHHRVQEAEPEPASHAAFLSLLHVLTPGLGFSTLCVFLTNFVKFKQQYTWLIFPLTVLLTCFMKTHPVTYVFKAAAKLKCIVLWLLTRLANINFYEVYSGHNIPSIVNNFEDIGPAFNFSVKVSKCFWFEKLPYLLL